MNLRRMYPVLAGSFIHRFESFDRFKSNFSFELSTVLFALHNSCYFRTPTISVGSDSILFLCLVFGVHHTYPLLFKSLDVLLNPTVVKD